MMNTSTQFIAATALVITASVIHGMMRADNNTGALDIARYYNMKRVPGDVDAAKAIVDDDTKWPSTACQAALNTTNSQDACVVARRELRNSILFRMNCFGYNSQVCMYLRNITAGIVQNRTVGGSAVFVGRSLSGTVPGQGTLTYRQVIRTALERAPLLFHPSYKAAQADNFFVLRTSLYTLIVFVVVTNLFVHIMDEREMAWRYRLLMRLLLFILFTLLPTILIHINNWSSLVTVLVLIWIPALLILIYFEAFLDASITRPWVHPFTFALVYSSLSVLALTENAVLNWTIVLLTILQSHCVSFVYMQVVWYWVGYHEKKEHGEAYPTHYVGAAAELYQTKEMQYALLLALIVLGVIPALQMVAPYDYESADLTVRAAPLVFICLAVWGTLYLQSMQLSDRYGKDKKQEPQTDSVHHLIVYRATRITAGKLAVSLLLLIFVTLYEFNMIGLYFRTLRAYNDKLPERAWQLDVANQFTIGTGFLPAPTLYL